MHKHGAFHRQGIFWPLAQAFLIAMMNKPILASNGVADLMSQVKWTRHHKRIGVQPYEPRKLTLTEIMWHAWTTKKDRMTIRSNVFSRLSLN